MSGFGEGWGTAGVLVAVALLAHEPWRWAGAYLGRRIPADSPVFAWVRAVATALVAGLVMRLILFPAGALAALPFALRLAAFVGGIGIFYLARRNLAAGVAGGAVILIGGQLLGA